MFTIGNKSSPAARIALVYITAGALLTLWMTVWAWFYPPETRSDSFWLIGLLATGVLLLLIGLGLGRIGRAARDAEASAPPPAPNTVPVQSSVLVQSPPIPPPTAQQIRAVPASQAK